MSFAAHTKKELTFIKASDCCKKSELSALVRMNGSIGLGQKRMYVDVKTENAAIARRIYSLCKELFEITPELLVRKKMRLKKNNTYIVRITENARNILQELYIVDESMQPVEKIHSTLVKKKCCKKAYLRGAFLAGGSVNNPERASYHLEIASGYQGHCTELSELANSFGLNAKCIERKKGFVLYIKESELISAFMSIVGAHQSLLRFEDIRIIKDMRNSVNRLVNCETANLNKTINAAMKQIENIKLIDSVLGLEELPDKLREIAELRLQHPDINLTELGDMLSHKVSKSGVNHRLRKLNEIADKLKAGKLKE
ncbi:DNA-binding protein WhiA [Desulfuribacillus alkaliarsenatis]|uniref:Probable cell division protein WhiA n=1 Tax=Desulfuribacillus alkaliarsenatis TaxID=766136 RepID=A0A1E5G438_9FIRM|nr:DNA-binding protein WhiA [Desulfuribacillus alkaliarsenatis]OEF97847.1 DNA-binding protein WhiA [Desulfuribacillus alkaliarsenatis]